MEVTLKQFAESKHGSKLLGLCPEYFTWVTCCLIVPGVNICTKRKCTTSTEGLRVSIPCGVQQHLARVWPLWGLGTLILPVLCWEHDCIQEGMMSWASVTCSLLNSEVPIAPAALMGNIQMIFSWLSSGYSWDQVPTVKENMSQAWAANGTSLFLSSPGLCHAGFSCLWLPSPTLLYSPSDS